VRQLQDQRRDAVEQLRHQFPHVRHAAAVSDVVKDAEDDPDVILAGRDGASRFKVEGRGAERGGEAVQPLGGKGDGLFLALRSRPVVIAPRSAK
jgi:hypothetical protein